MRHLLSVKEKPVRVDQDLEGNPERFRGTPSATQLGRKTRSSDPASAVWFQTQSVLWLLQWAFELGGECLAVGLLEILGALNEICRAELVCPQIYLLR